MKKKSILSIIILVWMLCLSACSNNSDNTQISNTSDQEELNISDEEEQDEVESKKDSEKPDVEDDDATEQTLKTEPANILIYYSNDDATAFTSEEVQINSLSPEEVMNALIEKGAIAADVEILSFETTTVDGKSTILLDFNDAFASYISSMGSTGEYFVMGSICNTFLDAYDCEQIQVTVDGDTLSTGHAEYPGYMTTFS